MSPTSSTSGMKYASISAGTESMQMTFLSRWGFQCSGECSTRS